MDNKNLKKQIISCGVLGVIIAVILIGIASITYRSINRTQEEEAGQYLQEIVSQYRNTILIKIDGNFQTLNALSTFIEKSESFDQEMVLLRLEAESIRNDFLRMGFVTPDKIGYFIDTDGTRHYNEDLSSEKFLDDILQGENIISEPVKDKFSDSFINVYGVPVYHNSQIVGALTAVSSSEDFTGIIDQNIFNGNAYTHIINSKGDFVLRSSHAVIKSAMTNIFDDGDISEEDQKRILESAGRGTDSFSTFGYKGQQYWATITPVGINDWHLFCLVPRNYLSSNYDTLIMMFFIIMLCITILFTLLFLYIYYIIRKNREQMIRLAYYDSLTGAYNRNNFIQEMPGLLKGSSDYAFAVMNINGFKFVNEFYGYDTGDMLLKHISSVLSQNTNQQELFYRDSADRFGMLFCHTGREELTRRLESIQEQIHLFKLSQNQSYHILCNFGVRLIDKALAKNSTDYDTIMNNALLALNSVKGNEMDSIAFYDETLHQKAVKQTRIESCMWDALNNREFVMYLQPKYSLETGAIHSAEALVRWFTADGAVIYPDEFIPVFERNGFITKLDMYMLEEACRYQALWKAKGYPLVPLSVNQSRVFFYDSEYLDKFQEIISHYQIDPSLIILEVTEGIAMTNLEQIKKVILRLHSMGFCISMDDFGSGYSSLNILKELPIDELKLDKVFLSDSENPVRSESIMRNIIRLAAELSITTVTEGVETKEQAEFLKRISCDIAQGYYFARPMPVENFVRLAFLSGTVEQDNRRP